MLQVGMYVSLELELSKASPTKVFVEFSYDEYDNSATHCAFQTQ